MLAATSLRGLPRCHRWAERLGDVGICSVAPRRYSTAPATIECFSHQHPHSALGIHWPSSFTNGQRATSIVPSSHTAQLSGSSPSSAFLHSRQRPNLQLTGPGRVRHVSYASKSLAQQDDTNGVLVVLVGWLGARQRCVSVWVCWGGGRGMLALLLQSLPAAQPHPCHTLLRCSRLVARRARCS
jgi:hypothetical protein